MITPLSAVLKTITEWSFGILIYWLIIKILVTFILGVFSNDEE